MSQDKKDFLVAQFGRAVGLKGELKLNLHTDFPEQFVKGRVLSTSRGDFEIEYYNQKRGLIKLVGINTPEDAKKLTNSKIYSNQEETKKYCNLKDGEYFWFELIGCVIVENSETLGTIKEVQRLPQSDYFIIETNKNLIDSGFTKSFMLPNIPQFIEKVDIENKTIYTKNAKDILEAS